MGASLVNLIEPHLFLDRQARTRGKAIAQMSTALAASAACAEDFHRGVIDREEMFSKALGSGVAIPHSMEIDALTSSIAVYVPREPIEWGEESVSLFAMMAFSKDTGEHFGELFESLIRVLSKRSNVERLAAHGGSYEQFIAPLLEII